MLEVLPVAGRVLLGAVLLVAGLAKLRDRSAFAASVRQFGFVPSSWSGRVATVLPVIEVVCGFLLLVGLAVQPAAVAATLLLLIFTLGIARNLSRGQTAPCACFGASSARRLGPSAVVRNVLLLAAGVVVLAGTVTAGAAPSVADSVGAALLAGMLVAAWQLLLAAHAVVEPARAVADGGRR